MRPGQQNKRGRGRNNNGGGGGGGGNNFNRKGQNPLTRTYDSSGPDVKIRGTAQHIAEKYSTLARDAQSAGDRVMAENYLQHAEHYNRIIAAAQSQMQERFQRDDRDGGDDRQDYNERDGEDFDGSDDNSGQGNDRGNQQAPQHQCLAVIAKRRCQVLQFFPRQLDQVGAFQPRPPGMPKLWTSISWAGSWLQSNHSGLRGATPAADDSSTRPISSHSALTIAPRPMARARPAWARWGTSTRLSNWVSTSTPMAIFTGVRMSWRA